MKKSVLIFLVASLFFLLFYSCDRGFFAAEPYNAEDLYNVSFQAWASTNVAWVEVRGLKSKLGQGEDPFAMGPAPSNWVDGKPIMLSATKVINGLEYYYYLTKVPINEKVTFKMGLSWKRGRCLFPDEQAGNDYYDPSIEIGAFRVTSAGEIKPGP